MTLWTVAFSIAVSEVLGVDGNGEWGDFRGSQAEDSTALSQEVRALSFQALFLSFQQLQEKMQINMC